MSNGSSPVDLNLWKQRLGTVPEWVWERTDLKTLVLADNDLAEISEKVGNLRQLRMLDLGHNRLTRMFSYSTLLGNRSNDTQFTGPFVSDDLNGATTNYKGAVRPKHVRNFPGGLWQMILENGRSRVFLGVNWILTPSRRLVRRRWGSTSLRTVFKKLSSAFFRLGQPRAAPGLRPFWVGCGGFKEQ